MLLIELNHTEVYKKGEQSNALLAQHAYCHKYKKKSAQKLWRATLITGLNKLGL